MKSIAVLAFDGVVAFDLALASDVFAWTESGRGGAAYRVFICSERRKTQTAMYSIGTESTLRDALAADTILVPGISDVSAPVPREILKVLRDAHALGRRIASVCTGAFVLAEAGILNGLSATTHWKAASELQRRFPAIDVNPDVLYVDNGNILTSAGAAAGMDLCLHMIRLDYGAAVAARSARAAVVPLERAGGQSQFVQYEIPNTEGSLNNVVEWLEKNHRRPFRVAALAKYARMSERSLMRRFQQQLGISPIQFLLSIRIQKAKELLETKTHSIDAVAKRVGFKSDLNFRAHFKKRVGVSPKAYRQAFTAESSKRVSRREDDKHV